MVTPADIDEHMPMTVGTAATFAGTTRHLLSKVHDAGYLPDLRRSNLLPLARAQYARTADASLPIAQASPARPAAGDAWRDWVGDGPHLSDSAWVDAVRGDWNGPVEAVVAAGILAVGVGGFITGLLRITGADPVGVGTNTVRFHAELLARLMGPLGEVPHLGAPTGGFSAEERALAEILPGCRYATISGPCIGFI
jgi:hypothetical protein